MNYRFMLSAFFFVIAGCSTIPLPCCLKEQGFVFLYDESQDEKAAFSGDIRKIDCSPSGNKSADLSVLFECSFRRGGVSAVWTENSATDVRVLLEWNPIKKSNDTVSLRIANGARKKVWLSDGTRRKLLYSPKFHAHADDEIVSSHLQPINELACSKQESQAGCSLDYLLTGHFFLSENKSAIDVKPELGYLMGVNCKRANNTSQDLLFEFDKPKNRS